MHPVPRSYVTVGVAMLLMVPAVLIVVSSATAAEGCLVEITIDEAHAGWCDVQETSWTWNVAGCSPVGYVVRLDGVTHETTAASFSATLVEGVHTFEVAVVESVTKDSGSDKGSGKGNGNGKGEGKGKRDGEQTVVLQTSAFAAGPAAAIDLTPPQVSLAASGPAKTATPAYTSTGASFIVNASDALSGMARVEWRLDDGAWRTVASGDLLDGPWPDGTHTLFARATDVAGLATTTSRTLTVDAAAPDLRIDHLDGPLLVRAGNEYVTSATRYVFIATDGGSGVASAQFLSHHGHWISTRDPSWAPLGVSGTGPNAIKVRATDNVGHTATKTRAFIVDGGAPSLRLITPEPASIDTAHMRAALCSQALAVHAPITLTHEETPGGSVCRKVSDARPQQAETMRKLPAIVAGVVRVQVEALDREVGVALVEAFVGPTPIYGTDAAGLVSFDWDTTAFPLGVHTLRLRATDHFGQVAQTQVEILILPPLG